MVCVCVCGFFLRCPRGPAAQNFTATLSQGQRADSALFSVRVWTAGKYIAWCDLCVLFLFPVLPWPGGSELHSTPVSSIECAAPVVFCHPVSERNSRQWGECGAGGMPSRGVGLEGKCGCPGPEGHRHARAAAARGPLHGPRAFFLILFPTGGRTLSHRSCEEPPPRPCAALAAGVPPSCFVVVARRLPLADANLSAGVHSNRCCSED